jgi:hypothetical protein
MIEEAEVPPTPRKLSTSDRNMTNTNALATQDPNANEPIFIWEEVRQAAAQPRK